MIEAGVKSELWTAIRSSPVFQMCDDLGCVFFVVAVAVVNIQCKSINLFVVAEKPLIEHACNISIDAVWLCRSTMPLWAGLMAFPTGHSMSIMPIARGLDADTCAHAHTHTNTHGWTLDRFNHAVNNYKMLVWKRDTTTPTSSQPINKQVSKIVLLIIMKTILCDRLASGL